MNEFEKHSEINAYKNLLEQNDYIGRKVAFEVAALFKAQFPNISMPIYEKYLETESQANTFRSALEELED
jgi:hypothetical protein